MFSFYLLEIGIQIFFLCFFFYEIIPILFSKSL